MERSVVGALGWMGLLLLAGCLDSQVSQVCPLSLCGDECVDLSRSREHCGACGNACSGAQVCAAGSCADSCPDGQSPCDGGCSDNQIDPQNCGACGVACKDGEACVAAECKTVIGGGDDTTAPTTTASPAGSDLCAATGAVEITLTADEPAVIYYTTDGSEPTTSSPGGINQVVVDVTEGDLQFFAVDMAGNVEAVQTETYVRDDASPGSVSALGATFSGSNTITFWTDPGDADMAGVLVTSTAGTGVVAAPEDCVSYGVGDMIGDQQVVYVGSDNPATFASATGWHRVRVYPFDAVGNFADASPAKVLVKSVPGAQSGTISVANPSTTPVATVPTQPPSAMLTPSAAYADGVLTLTVNVTNNGAKALIAPKLLASLEEGVEAQNALGMVQALPYWRPPNAGGIDTLATKTFTLKLGNLGGASNPLVVDVTLLESAALAYGKGDFNNTRIGLVDTDTLTSLATIDPAPKQTSTDGFGARWMQFGSTLAFSPDNRRLFTGSHEGQLVHVYDLAERVYFDSIDVSPSATPQRGNVQAIVGDWANNRLLAAVSYRCQRGFGTRLTTHNGNGGVDVVRINPSTLAVTDRVPVDAIGSRTMAYDIALSPNGATVAVLATQSVSNVNSRSLVYFLSTSTLLPLSGSNPVDMNAAASLTELRRVVFLDDSTAIVAGRRNARFFEIDLASDFEVTELTHDGNTGNQTSVSALAVAPDGAIWAGTHGFGGPGFILFPAVDQVGSLSAVFGNGGIASMAFHPNGTRAYLATRTGDVVVVDPDNPLVTIGTIGDSTNKRNYAAAVSEP